mgnify:CR=1 FL=1
MKPGHIFIAYMAALNMTRTIRSDAPVFKAIKAAEALNIGVISITQTGFVTGLFHMSLVNPVSVPFDANAIEDIQQSGSKQTVLLLHTSGTSGTKKLVPYTLDTLLVGVGCIVSAWALTPSDVCLNMMPLFHIGELARAWRVAECLFPFYNFCRHCSYYVQ